MTTKALVKKDLAYYLALPYTFTLAPDPKAGIFIKVNELPGCMSGGDTAEEAMVRIREAMEGWLEMALEDGDPIPEPGDAFSGRILLRVPKNVHRDLVHAADKQGASLNLYCATALARAVGAEEPVKA